MELSHVVGVDFSLTNTGAAWPDRATASTGAAGLTNPRTYVGDRAQALDELADKVYQLIISRREHYDFRLPRLVVVEDFPPGNTRSDPERGFLWWRTMFMMSAFGIPVLPVPPSTLKQYACGMGNANKREVIAGVREFFPQWPIMRTSKTGKELTTVDEDKVDAVVLMAIGCDLLGEPLVELPAKHRKALDKLELPPGVRMS